MVRMQIMQERLSATARGAAAGRIATLGESRLVASPQRTSSARPLQSGADPASSGQ